MKTDGDRGNRDGHLDWEQIGLDWYTMPQTLTFDELIASPIYRNYIDRYGRWQILLKNGVWYRQDCDNPELGRKCGPLEVVDPVCLHYRAD